MATYVRGVQRSGINSLNIGMFFPFKIISCEILVNLLFIKHLVYNFFFLSFVDGKKKQRLTLISLLKLVVFVSQKIDFEFYYICA